MILCVPHACKRTAKRQILHAERRYQAIRWWRYHGYESETSAYRIFAAFMPEPSGNEFYSRNETQRDIVIQVPLDVINLYVFARSNAATYETDNIFATQSHRKCNAFYVVAS